MSVSALAAALLLTGAPLAAAEALPVAVTVGAPPASIPSVVQVPTAVEPPVLRAAQAENPLDASETFAPAEGEAEQGTIIVRGRPQAEPGDPIAEVNAVTFSATQAVDDAVIAPVSMTYKRTVPKPLRSGTRNFLNNLGEPVVFLNYLLQLKPGKAMETFGRFAINSTVGLAGVMDVAKKRPFNLPRRPNGFGYTLGFYGVKPGAYLFLPIIGPTTVRDLFGRWVDLLVLPVTFGGPFTNPAYSAGVVTFRGVDDRAESDERLRQLREGDKSFYVALREDYLTQRQAEIDELRGISKVDIVPQSIAEPVPASVTPSAIVPASEELSAGAEPASGPEQAPDEPEPAAPAQPQLEYAPFG